MKVLDVFEDEKGLYVASEILQEGHLLERVLLSKHLSEAESFAILRQIVSGLLFYLEKGFVHFDVRSEKVLLVEKSSNKVKIADNGSSKPFGPGKKASFNPDKITVSLPLSRH